jgi:hypothetical protein
MKDNDWVSKADLGKNFSLEHLTHFVDLYVRLQRRTTHDNTEDSIVWKLKANGQY